MSLKVAIFEDDKDLADALKEMLELNSFEAVTVYSLKEASWRTVDVVVADYRNKIVNFEVLRKACHADGIPVLAISGAETKHRPQLLKPFTTDDLKNGIFQSLVHAKEIGLVRKEPESPSLIASLSSWLKGA